MHCSIPLPVAGLAVAMTASSALAWHESHPRTEELAPPHDRIKLTGKIDDGMHGIRIKPELIDRLKSEAREKGFVQVMDFPLADGQTIQLELREANPIAPGAKFVIRSSKDPKNAIEQPFRVPEGAVVLTGNVTGEPGSFAMLALWEKASYGLIQSSRGTSVIASGMPGNEFQPVIYDPVTALGGILEMKPWRCGSEPGDRIFEARAHDHAEAPAGGLAGVDECRVIKLALEYDFEFWTSALNANDENAFFYTLALAAAMDEIYRRDVGIGIQISYLNVWTVADDPWTMLDTSSQLDELESWYAANGDDVDRDAVMLCSARPLGGGIANIESLCNDSGYGVSADMNGFFTYPLSDFAANNWDIYVMSHELGHIVGSPHTHSFCPPLDQCAPLGFFGGCQTQQICAEGTLMGYCHLCPGGLSNMHLGFHPTAAQTIADYVAASDCLQTEPSELSANDDFAETLMNTDVTIDVLANDSAICTFPDIEGMDIASTQGGTMHFSTGSGPFGRTEIRFRPKTGFVGTDSFEYLATDELGNLELALVTIEVTAQAHQSDLLVIDPIGNVVQRFDWETGAFLGTLVPRDEGGVDFAYAACHGPENDLMVASFKNDFVIRYQQFSGISNGIIGGGPMIHGPNDVVSHVDRAYVSARDAEQVVAFDSDANPLAIYPIGARPNDIRIEPADDRLLVAWGATGSGSGVLTWNTQTNLLSDAFLTSHLDHAVAVCRLAGGDLLVADGGTSRIARYDGQTNAFLGWFMSESESAANNIGRLQRIEVGPGGRVFMTSSTGLHRLAANGDFDLTLESVGDGYLDAPVGLFFRVGAPLTGDLNGDGRINGADLAVILGEWGGAGRGDLNRDGRIDGTDLAIILGNWS